MADVPDAPDALAEGVRLLIDLDNLTDRLGAHVAFTLGRHGDDPDARSLLAEHVEMSGRLMVYLDSLAASATPPDATEIGIGDVIAAYSPAPPEAPQQTALPRLAELLGQHDSNTLMMWWDPEGLVATLSNGDTGEEIAGLGPTPDAALLALVDAVAPMEADRPDGLGLRVSHPPVGPRPGPCTTIDLADSDG